MKQIGDNFGTTLGHRCENFWTTLGQHRDHNVTTLAERTSALFFPFFWNPSLSRCDSDKNFAGILIDLYIVANYFSGPVSQNHCILQNVKDL